MAAISLMRCVIQVYTVKKNGRFLATKLAVTGTVVEAFFLDINFRSLIVFDNIYSICKTNVSLKIIGCRK